MENVGKAAVGDIKSLRVFRDCSSSVSELYIEEEGCYDILVFCIFYDGPSFLC